MPIPYTPPPPQQQTITPESPIGENQQWVVDPNAYAIEQERWRHDSALYSYGEYAMFVLLWHVEHLEAGLVARCPRCFGGSVVDPVVADAYKQPVNRKCPVCFGTTFEGGYRARIVRPSAWDFTVPDDRDDARGQFEMASASIQSTSDFRLRHGDYIFRSDGARWRNTSTGTNHLRTGFQYPGSGFTELGFNYTQVMLVDPSDVAYDMPPTKTELATMNVAHAHIPLAFPELEEIRGPLL